MGGWVVGTICMYIYIYNVMKLQGVSGLAIASLAIAQSSSGTPSADLVNQTSALWLWEGLAVACHHAVVSETSMN